MKKNNGMADLFGANPKPQSPVPSAHTLARTTDPSTSHTAAAAVVPKLREIQKTVLEHLFAAQYDGLSDLQLEEKCGSHGSTFRTRRKELVDLGLVRDSGRKTTEKGRKRIIWVATEFAR